MQTLESNPAIQTLETNPATISRNSAPYPSRKWLGGPCKVAMDSPGGLLLGGTTYSMTELATSTFFFFFFFKGTTH